jgi:hypothetical protein
MLVFGAFKRKHSTKGKTPRGSPRYSIVSGVECEAIDLVS